MDLILKYLPLIIFIYPILSWVDSRKRFTHNAKFYSDRAVSVKKYEEECSREGIKQAMKSNMPRVHREHQRTKANNNKVLRQHPSGCFFNTKFKNKGWW